MENKEKMTFLQWLDNYWYHHKAITIIGAFALVMVTVASCQFFSKKEPDVFMYYVGETNINVNPELIREELASLCGDDYNGDGKTVVDYKKDEFIMVDDADGDKQLYNPSEQSTITMRFNLELMEGDAVVYIMDKSYFENNLDYFEDLSNVLGYEHEKAVKGKGIALRDLYAYWNTSMKAYSEDYILCVRTKKDKFKDDYYNGNLEFFKNLVEFSGN